MKLWKRTSTRYGETPEPVTPYQRAAQAFGVRDVRAPRCVLRIAKGNAGTGGKIECLENRDVCRRIAHRPREISFAK